MKVGILTFHCAHNYGAVLQCYALQETLKSMGHDVEVIDYRPEYLLSPYKVFNKGRFCTRHPLKFIKRCIIEVLLLQKRIKRFNAFQRFINTHLVLSKKVIEGIIPEDYDAYIIGSDQVWNSKITGKHFDPVYFADFKFEKKNKKYITYAASMGKLFIPNEVAKKYILKNLQNFDAIGVRESNMIGFLQSFSSSFEIKNVLDPTLLVNSEIWDNIAVRPSINSKYVVVYQVRENVNTLHMANDIAKQIGAEVIQLVARLQLGYNNRMYQCASPEEFLGWMKYADCIVTTSFHGTVFSTIFNRPFYCIRLNDGADDRSESLLNVLGLSNRMIDVSESLKFETIEYLYSNEQANLQREQSQNFLYQSLK